MRKVYRRFIVVVFAMAVLASVATIVFVINNIPPSITLPTHKTPNPNGWDDFVRAGKLLAKATESPVELSPTELATYAHDNAAALALAHDGLSKAVLCPPIRNGNDASKMLSELAAIRQTARALAGEATYYHNRGNHERSVDCLLDCIEMGVEVPRGGCYLTALMGRWVEEYGTNQLSSAIPGLTPQELAHVADRLERIRAKRVTFSDIVLDDGRTDVAMYADALKFPQYKFQIASPIGWFLTERLRGSRSFYRVESPLFDMRRVESTLFNIRFAFTNKADALAEYKTYYEALALEQRGFYTGKSRVPVPNNIILLSVSDSDIARRRSPFVRNETFVELVRTDVALRRYHSTFGHYPESLSRLTPGFLAQVPLDPFGLGKSLQYGLLDNGRKFLLYSIGPDMRDDRGKPSEGLDASDTGDIVSGKFARKKY